LGIRKKWKERTGEAMWGFREMIREKGEDKERQAYVFLVGLQDQKQASIWEDETEGTEN